MLIVHNLNSAVVQVVKTCERALIVWLVINTQILGKTTAGKFISNITAAGL